MVKRYFELKEFFNHVLDEFPDLDEYFLSVREESILKSLSETMKNFQEVTSMLQKKDISIGEVRILFDGVISKYPTMNEYLSTDASIVHFAAFESGTIFYLLL